MMKTLKTAGIAMMILGMTASLGAQTAASDSSVQIKTVNPFFYAALEMKGSYQQMEASFGTLFGEAGKQGLGMNMPFGVYFSDPAVTPEADLKWEVGMALSDSAAVQPPLVLKKWAYTQTANMIYEGPFSDIGQAYGKLFGGIAEKGYVPAGPVREVYFGPPTQDDQGRTVGKIEIIVPVMKKQ
jgi:AraC family transcriptional regulator